MNELDRFLTYIFKDIDSDHLHLYKKIKQGVKCYHLNIISENSIGKGINSYNDISILLNSKDSFIEISSSADLQIVTVDNKELVKKWEDIFENYLEKNIDKEVIGILSSLSKTLLRDYKLTKINESI